MFINTFKFPNHSSLLRTMFTNTFNPPDQIASPRSVSATTLYTCNLKITIFYNSCGFGFLNIIPQWYLNIISQWYLSIIHFTDVNEMTYLLSKQQFIHTVYDPNFGWQLECFFISCILSVENQVQVYLAKGRGVDSDDNMAWISQEIAHFNG